MFHDWDVLQKDCSDLAEAVQTLEWTVAPYVADGAEADRKAQEVAKVVTDALWKRTPRKPGTYSHTFTQLLGALVHSLFRGYNVHEIEWVNDGDMVYPAAFHQLPPQFMQWETRAGQVDRLLFVADGETDEPKPFPEHKFIVALNTSGPDHPLFNASYYSLIAWYGAYKFGLGWFMEYCQKYGMPKLVFHYESDRDRQQLEKDLAEERVLNNILLKGDRAVDIANAPASGASLPQRELLSLAESQCHKLILGQTLTSDTSEHGGSLAQAKVHAGVQADIVKKRADFVADVLNSQLIPAIVLLNYGTLDVPMPELRYKIPQEGVTLERVQVVKTALEIKGMKLKKSEVYEFTGFAQPVDGDDVFESASEGAAQGGFGALFGQQPPPGGKGPQKGKPEPEAEQEAEKSRGTEPVSAANAEEVDAANPYGCNQYGEGWREPHNGRASKPGAPVKKTDEVEKEGPLKVSRGNVHNYSPKSVKVYLPDEGSSSFSSYFFLPKAWIRYTDDGMVEINIPEGKTVTRRGGISFEMTKEDLAESFEDSNNQENKWRVEESLDEALSQHFDEKAESSDDYIDVEEEVKKRLNEWRDEREKAYSKARSEFIAKNKDATARKIKRAGEEAARKVDAKYLKKYKADMVHAAKSDKPDSPTDPAQEWLAPIKAKFLEARKAGASMADLKKMLLTMHPNTKALAKAFANNILAGFAGDSEEVTAAGSNDDSRRRKEPIEMPDGTKCYTENCERHGEKTRQTNNNDIEYAHDDNSRTGGRSEKERSGGAVQRAGQASSHSEQGGDKEAGREHRRRIYDSEKVRRTIQEIADSFGIEKDFTQLITYTTTAQLQAVEDGRKPAFMESFPVLMQELATMLPDDSQLRYVAGNESQSIYNPESVNDVLGKAYDINELDSIVKLKIDSGESGDILGYGYNLNATPPGNKVVITCNGEAITSFDGPPDIAGTEYYASERTEDFRRAFPDMEWSFRIKE